VGGRRRHGLGILTDVGLHLQEVVRLVLDDDDVVLLCDLVNGAAAFGGLGGASGVLACWDGVQYEWLAGTTGLFVPVAEDVVHGLGEETLLVHCDAYGLQAQGERGLSCAGECVLFHDDVVTTLAEQAQSSVPGVGATGCQSALPVGVGRFVNELILLVFTDVWKMALDLLLCAR
jgi:hypothetical protein